MEPSVDERNNIHAVLDALAQENTAPAVSAVHQTRRSRAMKRRAAVAVAVALVAIVGIVAIADVLGDRDTVVESASSGSDPAADSTDTTMQPRQAVAPNLIEGLYDPARSRGPYLGIALFETDDTESTFVMALQAFQQDDGLIVYLTAAGPEDGPIVDDEVGAGQRFSCQMWGLISPTAEGKFTFTGGEFPEVSDRSAVNEPACGTTGFDAVDQLAPFGAGTFVLERDDDRLLLRNDAGEQFTFEWDTPEPIDTGPAVIPETTVPPTN